MFEDVEGLGDAQGGIAADEIAQGFAVEVLHDDVEVVALGAEIDDGDDVGVVESGGDEGFALEAGHGDGVVSDFREEGLEDDRVFVLAMPRTVNHAVGALAKNLFEAVARRDEGADGELGREGVGHVWDNLDTG